MYSESLERLRALCASFPETSERLSHGAPTFFVKKKTFLMLLDNHHGDGRLAIWCAPPPDAQPALRAEAAEWFFVPPCVGHRGWIGTRLDSGLDWDTVAEFVTEAYCAIAPARLVALVDIAQPVGAPHQTVAS